MILLKYLHSLLLGKCAPAHLSRTPHISSKPSVRHQLSIHPLLMVRMACHNRLVSGLEKIGTITTSHSLLRLYQMLLSPRVLGDQSRLYPVPPKTKELIHQANPAPICVETKSDMLLPQRMLFPKNRGDEKEILQAVNHQSRLPVWTSQRLAICRRIHYLVVYDILSFQLLESYQLIIDTSNTLTNTTVPPQGRLPPAESMERMLRSATYGVQMLENAIIQAKASETQQPPPSQAEVEDIPESGNATSATKKSVSLTARMLQAFIQLMSDQKAAADEDTAQEGQTCLGCNATATPEWRRGPLGQFLAGICVLTPLTIIIRSSNFM